MSDPANINPDELADLRAVQARLPYLRRKPLAYILSTPVVLNCLRNVVHAQRAARAAVRRTHPEDFQLT